jgi:hypothetical protein
MGQIVKIDGDWDDASCSDVLYTFGHIDHCLIGNENTLRGKRFDKGFKIGIKHANHLACVMEDSSAIQTPGISQAESCGMTE